MTQLQGLDPPLLSGCEGDEEPELGQLRGREVGVEPIPQLVGGQC